LRRSEKNLVDAYVNNGIAHFCSKEYNAAIENYSEALRINPNFSEAREKLDELLHNVDCPEELLIHPDFAEAREILAELLGVRGTEAPAWIWDQNDNRDFEEFTAEQYLLRSMEAKYQFRRR